MGLPPNTYALSFPAQPFPSQTAHPGALVHIPTGYDASKPLDIVVYSRGMNSCITAIAASEPTPCRPGGQLRHGSHIVELFDDARVNALLVFPEFRVEAASTDPGQLKAAGGTEAFLNGVLASDIVVKTLGAVRTVKEHVRSVFLTSHSAGWDATGEMVKARAVPVRGVALFDSLYANSAVFQAFALRVGRGEIANGRFSSLYTGGSPQTNSLALAKELKVRLPATAMRTGEPHAALNAADFEAPPVFFKLLRTEHKLVPEEAFGLVMQGGGFDPIP